MADRSLSIRFEGVRKSYGGSGQDPVRALDGIDLSLAAGKSLCLIGPSGCGKTTLLKVLNRLVEPDSGRVFVGDRDTSDLDVVTLRRSMGYVVQSGALFPHMNVAENIGLLWQLEGWDKNRSGARLEELLNLVGLAPAQFAKRFPHELSGGQRQRVGVARALALDPPIVLMDEPFGALDPVTRRELQNEFLALAARLQKTMLIVTHDLSEAFRLGDQVALLNNGQVAQVGSPLELKSSPASAFVESFIEEQVGGADQ